MSATAAMAARRHPAACASIRARACSAAATRDQRSWRAHRIAVCFCERSSATRTCRRCRPTRIGRCVPSRWPISNAGSRTAPIGQPPRRRWSQATADRRHSRRVQRESLGPMRHSPVPRCLNSPASPTPLKTPNSPRLPVSRVSPESPRGTGMKRPSIVSSLRAWRRPAPNRCRQPTAGRCCAG